MEINFSPFKLKKKMALNIYLQIILKPQESKNKYKVPSILLCDISQAFGT